MSEAKVDVTKGPLQQSMQWKSRVELEDFWQTKTNKSPVGLPPAAALGLVPIKINDDLHFSNKNDTPNDQNSFLRHAGASYTPAQTRSLVPAPGWCSTSGSEQESARRSSTSSARGTLAMQLRDERRKRVEAETQVSKLRLQLAGASAVLDAGSARASSGQSSNAPRSRPGGVSV
mmetsp:Transcript_128496/g.256689  ORF Transcript_128496/g.256689 Transcript_128496/m.256689 type:complete len:175 (+) Transcript_128496:96-620(+)